MTDEVTIWKPSEFSGSDLLPVSNEEQLPATGDIPIVGDENVDPEDLLLPTLALLQGQSKVCVEGEVEDAKPGRFFNTGTQEVLEGPLRVLVLHHSKSNAMFPNEKDPRYAGLEKCLSFDGVEGTVYGDCAECGRTKFKDGDKPLCTASHNFIVMSPSGPVKIRFSVYGYKPAQKFITQKMTQGKNFFDHPLIINVKRDVKELAGGQKSTYYYLDCKWITSESVPLEVRKQAFSIYQQIRQAHGSGKLKTTGDEYDEVPY